MKQPRLHQAFKPDWYLARLSKVTLWIMKNQDFDQNI